MKASIEKSYKEIQEIKRKIMSYCQKHSLDFSMMKNHIVCPLCLEEHQFCLEEHQLRISETIMISFNELMKRNGNKVLSGISVFHKQHSPLSSSQNPQE